MAGDEGKLKKELGLFDVFAICTGAMFSSGFFLLPGIAFANTGTSMALAYFLAGFLAVPAMFSKAELATAMPRAGGTYFYLDRSFGPLVGTVGGLGIWLAMVLKTAFAFVGFGAYVGLVAEYDGLTLSLGLVLLFLALNLVGAREAGMVQRVLVLALLAVMGAFLVLGVGVPVPAGRGPADTPFLREGFAGLFSTIGLVFVSYAGLTKVSSVAEEVRNPARNIPLGMALSLVTSMVIYAVGAYVLIRILDPVALARPDITPVATAADAVFASLPGRRGLHLVVVAAFAAFASTGNAAMLSASRYLLALGRDGRAPASMARVNSRGTPTWGVVVTAAAVALALLGLDVESVAKLASAFQLMIFSMVNLALVVMRESRLPSYDPGFRAPWYPWLQVVGFVSPFFLIAEMGHVPILFSFGLVGLGTAWYYAYARHAGGTSGAVLHVLARVVRVHRETFQRLEEGLESDLAGDGLPVELLALSGDQELREEDAYDQVVARALAVEAGPDDDQNAVRSAVAALVARVGGVPAETLARGLLEPEVIRLTDQGIELHHLVVPGLPRSHLVLARWHPEARAREADLPCGVIYLITPESAPSQHLRILTHLALQVEREGFREEWLAATERQELRETLLRYHRFLSLRLGPEGPTAAFVGKEVRELDLPAATLLAAIRRGSDVLFPRGDTRLEEGDRITLVGDQAAVEALAARFEAWTPAGGEPAPDSSDG